MPPRKPIELARSCVDAGVTFKASVRGIEEESEDYVSVRLVSDEKIVDSEYSRQFMSNGRPIISGYCTRDPKNKRILKMCRVLYMRKDKGCSVSAEVFPEDVLSEKAQEYHRR